MHIVGVSRRFIVSTNESVGGTTPVVMTYVPIPSAPFSTGYARPVTGLAVAGQVFPVDLGNTGPLDVIFDGNFSSGISLNGLVGTEGKPYRFVNKDSNFIAGSPSSTTFSAVSDTNNCNLIEMYGKDSDTPWFFQAGAGMSGLTWFPLGGAGASVKMVNWLGTNIGYTMLLASQGDYTTPTLYNKIHQGFCRIDGIVSEGEGTAYLGHNGTPYGYSNRAIYYHNASKDKGREGLQNQHVSQGFIYNETHINSGQSAIAGQTNLCQFHDCAKHIVENCIFDGAPQPFNLFTHDITFRNCYFRFNSASGFIGRTDNSYFAGSPNLNGIQVLFDNCEFVYDDGAGGTITYLTQVAERTANIQYLNCKFQKITNIFQDQRAVGYTNTLIGTTTTNGNAIATTIPGPTYVSIAPTNSQYLCLTSTYHYNLHRGYRTPVPGDQIIIDTDFQLPVSTAYGTAFGSLVLPTTVKVTLQDGTTPTLNVTWAQGSYDGNTSGTYTINGTLTTFSGNTNTYSLQAQIKVTVAAAPSIHKVVLISCGPAAGAYISTGNWNHLRYDNPNGVLTIKGNSSTDTLSGFRCTDGTSTAYGFNMTALMSGNNVGQTPGSLYPDIASVNMFYTPGGGTTTRGGKITGLDNTKSYTVKIFSSCATFLSGAQTVNVTITGATTSAFAAGFNEKGNTATVQSFTCLPNVSGEIAIAIQANTGTPAMNVIELNFDLP